METDQTWSPQRAQDIIAAHSGLEGPLLPILHGLQAAFGHVPPDAVPIIAQALNLSRADVHGVLTFYHDFRSAPTAARVHVKLCRAEACQARGVEAIALAVFEALEPPVEDPPGGAERRYGAVLVEPVYCLGLCAVGPAALINGAPHARLDAAALRRAIAPA